MADKRNTGASAGKNKNTNRSWPTAIQFHEILKQIAPDESMIFTEAAVMSLRSTFFAYLDMIGSSLTEHDSLKEEEKVVNALTINNNPQFEGFVRQAQELIIKTASASSKRPSDNNNNSNSNSNSKGSTSSSTTTTAATALPAKKKRGKRKQKFQITPEMEAEQDRLLQESKQAAITMNNNKKQKK